MPTNRKHSGKYGRNLRANSSKQLVQSLLQLQVELYASLLPAIGPSPGLLQAPDVRTNPPPERMLTTAIDAQTVSTNTGPELADEEIDVTPYDRSFAPADAARHIAMNRPPPSSKTDRALPARAIITAAATAVNGIPAGSESDLDQFWSTVTLDGDRNDVHEWFCRLYTAYCLSVDLVRLESLPSPSFEEFWEMSASDPVFVPADRSVRPPAGSDTPLVCWPGLSPSARSKQRL